MKILKNKKNIIIILLVIILLAIITVPSFFKDEGLYGIWYKYHGKNILEDKNIPSNIRKNECIIFGKSIETSFEKNGLIGNSAYYKRGNKLFIGDASYRYEIKKVDGYNFLFLYSTNNTLDSVYVSGVNIYPEK